ncbi:MAG TPA: Ig-like domain-containing protein, partial [Mucilaginibacter sp.]
MLNKKGLFFGSLFAAFCVILLNFGCANRQLPQGGPRDHDPPKLLKATPANMTRHFKDKVIQLDFDEYFRLTNTYAEISMSPTPAKLPEYKVKGKSLVITLKDTLEKNTTYVINFGKAIADVNENNVLKNFTYVFSTGEHIDSLSVSGQVINSLTQQREKDVTVMLFTLKQDSLLFGKKKPTVFATTDSAGHFSLNNLHPDDYRIYALKETAPNKIYDNDAELIGFSSKVIHLEKDSDNIKLTPV